MRLGDNRSRPLLVSHLWHVSEINVLVAKGLEGSDLLGVALTCLLPVVFAQLVSLDERR